jgi:hypothetical protein
MRTLKAIFFVVRNIRRWVTLNDVEQRWLLNLVMYPERQVKYQLRNREGMCCMGQLCDIVEPKRWDGEFYVGHRLKPPTFVTNKISLTDHLMNDLMHMNDHGRTWPQIAQHYIVSRTCTA